MSEQKSKQDLIKAVSLAIAIAESIPDTASHDTVLAALARVVAPAAAAAAEGNPDRAIERLAIFNRLVESLTVDHCLILMSRELPS